MKFPSGLEFCLAALALAAACSAPGLTRRALAGDMAIVREGRYQGTLRIKDGDQKTVEKVEPLRRQIEEDPGFLRQVGEKYFSIPAVSDFRYKYVAEDSVAKRLVLRYFASDPHPIIYAGWQLLFEFSEPNMSLVQVLATEVPLE